METTTGHNTSPIMVTEDDLAFFEQITGFHGIAKRIIDERIGMVKECH